MRRRLRGAAKNAATWGIAWAVLGFAATLVLRVVGVDDAPVSVLDAAITGVKIGVGGAIAGVAFSIFIALAYRNRRIRDIRWWKFGIGGAVITSITAFVQGASILGGGGLIPWRYMNPTLAMFALFGFGVAAVSMKLAQSTTSRPDDEQRLVDNASNPLHALTDGATAIQSAQSHRDGNVERRL